MPHGCFHTGQQQLVDLTAGQNAALAWANRRLHRPGQVQVDLVLSRSTTGLVTAGVDFVSGNAPGHPSGGVSPKRSGLGSTLRLTGAGSRTPGR